MAYVKISGEAVEEIINSRIEEGRFKNWAEANAALGRTHCYLRQVINRGTMNEIAAKLFCDVCDVDLDDIVPQPKQGITGQGIEIKTTISENSYPRRIRVTIYYDGESLGSSTAVVKGDSNSDVLQAIDYAVHRIHKVGIGEWS